MPRGARFVETEDLTMCCRYYFGEDEDSGRGELILRAMARSYAGQYKTGEIFPGDAAPAMIRREERIVAVPAVFGFPGTHDSRFLLNARAETAARKRTFSPLLADQRILLPATGFFEWGRDPKKTKYLFTLGRGKMLYLCGLYRIVDGVRRFVIFTRSANESMAETHDRMPVIIGDDEVRPYLTDARAAMEILATAAPVLYRNAAAE